MASVKPSLVGLAAALGPETADPLGTDRKRRGMEAYYAEKRKSDPNFMSGPLPDPAWEGYGQALSDAGVTKVAQDASRPQGIAEDPTQPGWAQGNTPTWTPSASDNALTLAELSNKGLMKPNGIGVRSRYLRKGVVLDG